MAIQENLQAKPHRIIELPFAQIWTRLLGVFASISKILTLMCNLPVVPSLDSSLLKDISATVQQIDVRAEQMDFFATEVGALHRRTSTPIHIYSARYTK
ncbi:hypothetical protein H0H81_008513 [Sphagnurus paluster]|uniref:Uncharacterized protein n=1 Tax=Sphagnurus paluster TaxID=117069 RepID=A0A9P7GIX1_9AGAR|nr:hypothetical protein H0H81_008513 [Sphagnurus paluster]